MEKQYRDHKIISGTDNSGHQIERERSLSVLLREPDVYRDPSEVIWKSIAINTYYNVNQILSNGGALTDPEIRKLQVKIIDAFNSNHSQDIFYGKAEASLETLGVRLSTLGKSELFGTIEQEVLASRAHVDQALFYFKRGYTFYPVEEQTHVIDGAIEIAGMPIEKFSLQKDYFSATLKLFLEKDSRYRSIAESSFRRGFVLTNKEKELISHAKQENWNIVDLINQQLLNEQIVKRYKSLEQYEYQTKATVEVNSLRKQNSLKEAYYFMGFIISTVAHYSNDSIQTVSYQSEISDPVAMFLHAAGKDVTDKQLAAVRKITLAHSSHGLNSGELTAQLAASVRTTFPRALIASFNVRSGILHAGAIDECMKQTKDYLVGGEDPEAYINRLLENEGKLYGFGHRIHKISPNDQSNLLGKDPRVALYIDACLEGFPEKSEDIDRLVKYASTVRQIVPSLGANTDFGAAVLFHSLELEPNAATSFFLAFRTPGVCAQIVNELAVKGNSRRPPFAPVLHY